MVFLAFTTIFHREYTLRIYNLSFENKVKTLLCPTSAIICRLVNKYIKIVFKGRDKLDEGNHPLSLTFQPLLPDTESESDTSDFESESDSSTDCDN